MRSGYMIPATPLAVLTSMAANLGRMIVLLRLTTLRRAVASAPVYGAPMVAGWMRRLAMVVTLVACTRPTTMLTSKEALARATDGVTAWLAANAVALEHLGAGHGVDDMVPLSAMIGTARIVGLGEATHGTSEFFQLKHRVLEYAVTKLGFTMFGIEAGQPECRTINEYVATGRGDLRAALIVTLPIWNTEEVVALIEWMRAWNADPSHDRKLKFVGFDMQTTFFAYRNVVAFLAKVAPDQVATLTKQIAVLGGDIGPLMPEDWARILAELSTIGARFDAHRSDWTERSGAASFVDARHDITVMEQAARFYQTEDEGLRDRSMSDNVDWLLAQEPPGSRIILWAHNGHIALQRPDRIPMGGNLRRRFGRDYFSVGFAFGEGGFRTVEVQGNRAVLVEHTVGAATPDDVTAPFTATGRPILVADLRAARASSVADWFMAPHPMREAGGTFSSEADLTSMVVLPAQFDAVIYVKQTTGSRPLQH